MATGRWSLLAAGLLTAALLAAPSAAVVGAPLAAPGAGAAAAGAAAPVAAVQVAQAPPALPAGQRGQRIDLPRADPQTQDVKIPVGAEPDGSAVSLDATVIAPAQEGRHPAVLLAHGFGGSKADLVDRARELASAGYVTLIYTARGFGASGGRIHLDDPDFEVADARTLLDHLATRADVQLDGVGDPRVGVAGGSYGGALALMLAGSDPRVDAVASAITWHDLANALVPGRRGAQDGVFKRRWASLLFSSAVNAAPRTTPVGPINVCGRFDPTLCRVFLDAADTGTVSPTMEQILRRNSPAPLLSGVKAPTLLLQGMRDSLFGLDQSDATARALTAQGVPVALRWFDGGHDGGAAPSDADTLLPWFERYLTDAGRSGGGEPPLPAFSAPVPVTGGERDISLSTAPPVTLAPTGAATGTRVGLSRAAASPGAPGAQGDAAGQPGGQTPADGASSPPPGATSSSTGGATTGAPTSATGSPADGSTALLLSPPGGDPSAISNAGGFGAGGAGAPSGGSTGSGGSGGGAAAAAAYALAALPGQHVAFDTPALADRIDVAGTPRVRLRVISTARDATLFASIWRMTPAGPVSPRSQVVPIRVATTPGTPVDVDVALPPGTYSMAKGAHWRVLVSTTDAGYAVPQDARFYTVGLADDSLVLPVTTALTDPSADDAAASGPLAGLERVDREVLGAAIGLAALLLLVTTLALVTWVRRRRGDRRDTRVEDAGVPLVVDNLVKTYKDGHRAVDDVSWRAEAGQVVGLLGPNGAGKTTTMRMLVGLIRPDAGSVHVLGEPVHAGSPVLRRVGALIEGPGFLPHLTGRQNLHAYWEATGRDPADAQVEAALEVAALGDAVDRPVRTYSQGMRQRLGIAQAMLGRPDVLLLDEPTNGLDPPQIAAMRPILRDYARTGRTVVVSSHLLAEVEQTCTHVVVMNRGRVIVTGSVAELVTGDGTTVITLGPACDPEAVAEALRESSVGRGLSRIRLDPAAHTLTLVGDAPRGDLVTAAVEAGADIESVVARKRLEEVFLGVLDHDGRPVGATDDTVDTDDADAPDAPKAGGRSRRSRVRRRRKGTGAGSTAAGADSTAPGAGATEGAGATTSTGPPATAGSGAGGPDDSDPAQSHTAQSDTGDDEEGRMNRLRQVRRR